MNLYQHKNARCQPVPMETAATAKQHQHQHQRNRDMRVVGGNDSVNVSATAALNIVTTDRGRRVVAVSGAALTVTKICIGDSATDALQTRPPDRLYETQRHH
jgi:trimethylamine:corrinoid methyltransferase-like protein